MTTFRRVWSLLGLLLLPLAVAGGFLWATWDFESRLDRVAAAAVDLDKPVTVDGRLVPLGRQLAGDLVAGPDAENFTWTVTDADDAAAGLNSGRYAAVVTIPEDFSARATSYAGGADRAERATIVVQTSEVSGIADPVVGRSITEAATRALSTSLTEEYLKNIYLGFNRLSGQFRTLTDGADRLAPPSCPAFSIPTSWPLQPIGELRCRRPVRGLAAVRSRRRRTRPPPPRTPGFRRAGSRPGRARWGGPAGRRSGPPACWWAGCYWRSVPVCWL